MQLLPQVPSASKVSRSWKFSPRPIVRGEIIPLVGSKIKEKNASGFSTAFGTL